MRVPAPTDSLPRHTDAIVDLATGATNASGSFTLDVGATVTTVPDKLCTNNAMVSVSPRSAAAASSGWWISATKNGSFTVTHDAAPAGCLFDYEIRRR